VGLAAAGHRECSSQEFVKSACLYYFLINCKPLGEYKIFLFDDILVGAGQNDRPIRKDLFKK